MTTTTNETRAEAFAEGVALWERFEELAPEEVEELLDSLEEEAEDGAACLPEDASEGDDGFPLVAGAPLGHETGELVGSLDAGLYCAALWEAA
jgi:hypothetical protein